MAENWFFDDELTRLRWQWVASVRDYSCGASPRRGPALRRAHATANAYFDRLTRLQRHRSRSA
jgi:hypothetical protein